MKRLHEIEINAQKIYAYSSVRTGNKKSEMTKNIHQTKAYRDVIKMIDKLPFFDKQEENDYDSLAFVPYPECTVQIDLVTWAKSNQYYKLNKILEQSSPYDTAIVITSLNAFGDCANIQKYYRIFRKKKIGVLFIDYTRESGLSEYSTCDFSFKPLSRAQRDRAYDLVANLTEDDIKDNRGQDGKEFNDAFYTAYWLYELFLIPEQVAAAMAGFSKNGFHIKADEYEQTYKYKQELENMDRLHNISHIPKRNRPVPKNFEKLVHWYHKKDNLEVACIHCKVPMIFPIDYKRLILKKEGGKSELIRCLKNYDEELISAFETWVQQGKAPTEFYQTTEYYKNWKKDIFSSSIY